jgi:Protein of unknown function (DUF2934)
MSDTVVEPEEARVRERAYFLWEREGRPNGRADEHWRRAAAEVGAEARDGRGVTRTEAEAADGSSAAAAVAPRTSRTAQKKHRGPVGATERAEATPVAKRDPSGGASRRRAEPADGSVPFGGAPQRQRQRQRQRRSAAAPRGPRRKDRATAEAAAGIPPACDEGGARPPPG